MRRWLIAVVLVSCTASTTSGVSATPAQSATPSAVTAARSPTVTVTSSPTPDPASLSPCVASQLQAVAAGAQATDFFAGAVFVANRGTSPCTLRGNPEVFLLASDGLALDVRRATVTAGAPAQVVVPVGQFQPDPAGVKGIGASAPLQWSNYCDDALPRTFRLTLPDAGGTLDGTFIDLAGKPVATFGTPRCDDASGPSTLVVYPFQEPVR